MYVCADFFSAEFRLWSIDLTSGITEVSWEVIITSCFWKDKAFSQKDQKFQENIEEFGIKIRGHSLKSLLSVFFQINKIDSKENRIFGNYSLPTSTPLIKSYLIRKKAPIIIRVAVCTDKRAVNDGNDGDIVPDMIVPLIITENVLPPRYLYRMCVCTLTNFYIFPSLSFFNFSLNFMYLIRL